MSQFARLLLSCPESISRFRNSFRPWRTSTEQIHSSSSIAVKVDFTILKCALTAIGVRKSVSKPTSTAPEVLSTVFQPISAAPAALAPVSKPIWTAPAVLEPHSKGMWTRVNDRFTVSSGPRPLSDFVAPDPSPAPTRWTAAAPTSSPPLLAPPIARRAGSARRSLARIPFGARQPQAAGLVPDRTSAQRA